MSRTIKIMFRDHDRDMTTYRTMTADELLSALTPCLAVAGAHFETGVQKYGPHQPHATDVTVKSWSDGGIEIEIQRGRR